MFRYEPNVDQFHEIIESVHAVLDSKGRDGYPLIYSGFGRKVVKCRNAIKCVVRTSSTLLLFSFVLIVEQKQMYKQMEGDYNVT